MRRILVLTTALMLTAAPAHAQLLGGGLGGAIGGTIGGTLGGVGSIGSPLDTVTSTTQGTLRGSGSTKGSQHVDRKSGRVQAKRDADASSGGDISQTATAPARMIGGSAAGNAGGSGSGSMDAQLIGTDAIGGTVQSLRGTASGLTGAAGGLTGSLTGSASGSGGASGSGSAGPIAGSGAASGSGNGGLTVTKGTPIVGADGDRIGSVRRVFTNASGEVEQLLVKVDGETALLPAANFSANGNAVVSAMTESQIKQLADQQQETGS